MEQSNAVELLVNKFYFKRATAIAYIDFNGCCGYCGTDLINDRTRYWAGTVDHLLARTRYPDYTEDERNYVLCCAECNSLKHDYDVLMPGEVPGKMLETKKDVLMNRAKEFLKIKREESEKVWEGVKAIVCG